MDDVTNRELDRRIADLSTAIKEDLSEIKSSLPGYLPREVYEARHTALATRVTNLETEQAREAEQRRNLFKWVVGAIVVPVILFVGQIIINAQSGGVTQ